MGKGKRSREARAAVVKEPEKKGCGFFRNKTVRLVAIILAAAIVVAGFGYLAVSEIQKSTGSALRSTVSVTSEHYEVNNAMMSYLFRSAYTNFYSQYYYYLSYMGLDTTKSLKLQKYGERTWFDFFMDTAVSNAKEMLTLAEGALAENMTLTDDDKADIDETIEAMKKVAVENGYGNINNYLAAAYGNGIKEKDVRAVMEIQALASKYYEKLIDSYEFDKEDYAKYCEENKSKFYTMGYVSYNFETEEQAAEAAKAETYEALVEYINNYEIEKAKAAAKDGAEVDEAKIKETVETKLKENTKEKYTYSEVAEVDKWLFAEEREVGDTYTNEKTVYWVLKPINREEDITRNVRHILVSTQEKADELLAEWKKDPTVEKFTELVEKNTLDSGSATTGGLYENVYPNQMITEFNDWLFDENRKAGDAEVVHSESYGYHVIWYIGESDLATWEAKADSYLEGEAYDADYEKLGEAHPISVDNSKLSKIPG